jgi:hypothetical protein
VLCTATTPPEPRPARTPSDPVSTSSTSASLTTQTHTTSLTAASSAGEEAAFAAVPSNGESEAGRRAHSVTGNPASMIRRAIGPPWLPSPMNPTRTADDISVTGT